MNVELCNRLTRNAGFPKSYCD